MPANRSANRVAVSAVNLTLDSSGSSAPPAPFTPTDISDLTYWVDTTDYSTMFQTLVAEVPTTNVTGSGQVIRAIQDKGSAGIWWKNRTSDATSPNSALVNSTRAANFTSAGLKFLSAFSTSTGTVTASLTRPAVSSIFALYRKATTGSRAFILASSSATTPGVFGEGTDRFLVNSCALDFVKNNASTLLTSTNLTIANSVNVDDTLANMQFWLTGSADVSTVPTVFTAQQISGANVDAGNATTTIWNALGRQTTSYSDMDLVELLVYTRVLTTAERNQVFTYLSSKIT